MTCFVISGDIEDLDGELTGPDGALAQLDTVQFP